MSSGSITDNYWPHFWPHLEREMINLLLAYQLAHYLVAMAHTYEELATDRSTKRASGQWLHWSRPILGSTIAAQNAALATAGPQPCSSS